MNVDVGMAIFSEFVEGILRVAVDMHGPDATGRTLEPLQPLGLYSRPLDPVLGPDGAPISGATAFFFFLGSDGYVMPTTDPRLVTGGAIPTDMPKGSTLLYSAKSWLYMNGETGTTMLRVPYGEDKAMVLAMATEPVGQEQVALLHGNGAGLIMVAGGKNSAILKNAAGDAYIEINDEGIVFNGNAKLVGGIVAGEVVAAEPVLLATQALSWFAQATAFMAAVAAAGGGTIPPGLVPPVAAPIATTKLAASP